MPDMFDAARAAGSPIEQAVAVFMLHPETFAQRYWIWLRQPVRGLCRSRAGVLGGANGGTVSSVFVVFEPDFVRAMWDEGVVCDFRVGPRRRRGSRTGPIECRRACAAAGRQLGVKPGAIPIRCAGDVTQGSEYVTDSGGWRLEWPRALHRRGTGPARRSRRAARPSPGAHRGRREGGRVVRGRRRMRRH